MCKFLSHSGIGLNSLLFVNQLKYLKCLIILGIICRIVGKDMKPMQCVNFWMQNMQDQQKRASMASKGCLIIDSQENKTVFSIPVDLILTHVMSEIYYHAI